MKDYIAYLKFDDLTMDELVDEINKKIKTKEKTIICTPNLDGMRIAYNDMEIRKGINRADFVTIDGKPVQWIAKICGKHNFKNKISGSDLTPEVLELANSCEYSILIFGGKEDVVEKAKLNIEKKYPNIVIKAVISPVFGFESNEKELKEYINNINSYKADIVLMCTGFPKTEKYMFSNFDLFANSVYMCVGATVDFIAGNIKRAPKWMSNSGLEWFYRLTKDFKRLFKRYWLDLWFLIKLVFLCVFFRKKIEKMRED